MYNVDKLLEDPGLVQKLRGSVLGQGPPPLLRSVKIKLTARCNLRCEMCRYGKGLDLPELSGTRWQQLLGEMRDLGCRKVHFSGGEVLVRKDFEQLIQTGASLGMKMTFTSNLTLLSKERAKALMRHKISSISTSLDGADAPMHDSVRGIAGSFDRTRRAIAWLMREKAKRGAKTRLRINFVMMRRNFMDYPRLVELAGELGAADVVPMPVDTKKAKLRLSAAMIREYNAAVAPEVEALRRVYGFSCDEALVYPFGRDKTGVALSREGLYAGGYYQKKACYTPFLHMFVAWDGHCYLCCMTNGRIESLGNLASSGVREVFWGPKFEAIRRRMMVQRLASCEKCDMFGATNRKLAQYLPGPRSGPIPGRELDPKDLSDLSVLSSPEGKVPEQSSQGRISLPVLRSS